VILLEVLEGIDARVAPLSGKVLEIRGALLRLQSSAKERCESKERHSNDLNRASGGMFAVGCTTEPPCALRCTTANCQCTYVLFWTFLNDPKVKTCAILTPLRHTPTHTLAE
jgi:hypothetical protein